MAGMVLPLPFYSLLVAFCHIVHLCYGCTTLATAAWQAMGFGVHVYWAHHSGICARRLHCNPIYAWVVAHLV